MRCFAGKIMALAVLLALSVPFVSAYSDMGMALSNERISGCPGYAIPVDLTLTNNDDVTHTYSLSLELPQGWKFMDNGFLQPSLGPLAAGKSEKIMFWINPPVAAPGIYDAQVRAKMGVDENSKKLEVEVLKCYDVSVSVPETVDVCNGAGFQYAFSVANNGKSTEEFDVVVSGSWGAELYRESVVIAAGKTANLAFNVASPQSGKLTVKAVSRTSYAMNEKYTQLNVNNCYDFSADLEPKEASACVGGSAKFVLHMRNLGTSGDAYAINAPPWVVPSQGNVTLLSSGESYVEILTYPEVKGRAAFELTVVSKGLPKLEKKLAGAVEAKDCRGVEVLVYPATQEVCGGLPATFKVAVKNTGMNPDSYELQTDTGSMDTDKVNVEAGETKEAILTIDTRGAEFGERPVTVAAMSGDVIGHNSAQLAVRNCYAAELAVSPEKAGVCFGDEDAIVYTMAIKNVGKFADNYTILADGEAIGFVNLAPGELSMLSAEVNASGFAEGTRNMTFGIKSEHAAKEAVLVVTVKPRSACYGIDISSENDAVRVEPGNGTAIAVKIKDTGDKADTFAIETNGSSWVYVSQNNVSLEAGGESYVYLYVSPGYDTMKDVYNISLRVKSENAEKEMMFRVGVGVTPETAGQTGISIPTGGIISLSGNTGKVVLLALIVLVIIIILTVKFVLFVK